MTTYKIYEVDEDNLLRYLGLVSSAGYTEALIRARYVWPEARHMHAIELV